MELHNPKLSIEKLLRHSIEHLKCSSLFDHQISLISVDNAFELSLRLNLNILNYIKFKKLLFLEFQPKAPNIISTKEINEIWNYHRIRNEVYHKPENKEILRERIINYVNLAQFLFNELFLPDNFLITDLNSEEIIEFRENWEEIKEEILLFYFNNVDIDLDISELKEIGFDYYKFDSDLDPTRDEFKNSVFWSEYFGIINLNDYLKLLEINRYDKKILKPYSSKYLSRNKLVEFTQYLKKFKLKYRNEQNKYYKYDFELK